MRSHLIAPLAICALALSACGDGGGVILTPPDDNPPPACTATTCGEVRIGLVDADGDFISYVVDVVSIKLERANGSTVQTLPTRQRVDFGDLVDVTEFVTAATIPNGTYVGGTIRLDYTNADMSVEVAGQPVPATVVDENGAPLGVVDVDIQLDNANHVVIAPGTPALLQLDFDLPASHEVNFLTIPVTATADPFLVASIVPIDVREFRARGPLLEVDEAAGSYVVDLRPFNHKDARNGEFTVKTTADTAFEVDGTEMDQADGLAAIADLGVNTPTAAQGVYDVDTAVFTATKVLAGDSVPGADFDAVLGNVLSRSGNDLIVRGGTVIRRDDNAVFIRGDITVQLGPNTTVLKEGGGATALTTDAISVGQRILAYGNATASNTDPVLNAFAGRVRLLQTHLTGTVVNSITGELRLDLFGIDGRNPAFFDYTGTGGSATTDADPNNYQVDTGALDVSGFDPDEPARVFGFVTPFGDSPPDFEGQTLVNFDDIQALLGIAWGFGGTDAPFQSMGRNGFVVDPGNPDLGARHFIKVGPRIQDLTALASPITIEPATAGRTLYAVSRPPRQIEVFTDFEEYAQKVNDLLNGGSSMRTLTARGSYDADSTTLTANYVAIAFTTP